MARVLVVEDADGFRALMRQILQAAGHEVVEAESGRAALALLDGAAFDLLVTDVVMPDGDGIELIRAVAAAGRRLPVLAVSGGGHDLPAAVSLTLTEAAGAHRTLYKPFRAAEFLAVVGELLGPQRRD